MKFKYASGEDIREKDRVKYHGEPGEIEFVVTHPTGVTDMDWYLEQFPGGGFMINAENFGSVFIDAENIDEFLTFVARGS